MWDNEKIAQFFKKFAGVFAELGDYRMKLMKETEETGIPITRSLMLEFDDTNIHIDDQFMLGSDIMMAPILVKGTVERKVFFPHGTWKHYFTGETIKSRGRGFYKNIDCPLGTPAVFKRVKNADDTSGMSI